MLDTLANFDALGLGALAGSVLFLAGLLWVLLEDRSFEELNRATGSDPADPPASAEPTPPAPSLPAGAALATTDRESGPRPGRPRRPRRAA